MSAPQLGILLPRRRNLLGPSLPVRPRIDHSQKHSPHIEPHSKRVHLCVLDLFGYEGLVGADHEGLEVGGGGKGVGVFGEIF